MSKIIEEKSDVITGYKCKKCGRLFTAFLYPTRVPHHSFNPRSYAYLVESEYDFCPNCGCDYDKNYIKVPVRIVKKYKKRFFFERTISKDVVEVKGKKK